MCSSRHLVIFRLVVIVPCFFLPFFYSARYWECLIWQTLRPGGHQGFVPTPPSLGHMGEHNRRVRQSTQSSRAGGFVSRLTAAPSNGHKALSPFHPWLSGHANVGMCVTGWSRGAPSPPASDLGAKAMASPACSCIWVEWCVYHVIFMLSVPLLQTVERVAPRFVLKTCARSGQTVPRGSTRSNITPEGDV